MKQISTILLILILFISASCKQTKTNNATKTKVDNYLSELEKLGFNGSVLVSINEELTTSKGYGFSNIEKQIANSPATIFDIGSVTKQFTATAILKLEMQSKLSTEDKLSKFFNNVPRDKENITIHDLLRHQSGLISNVGGDYDKVSEEDFLNKVFSSKLQFGVGEAFSYSNVGYSLLAMIIEKVSSQDYETYLYKELWKPAKMEMTGYSRPLFDTSLIAIGYYSNDSIWGKPTEKEWNNASPYWHLKGNGGILSTTEDLYNWDVALRSDLILSKEAKQKLYHPKLRDDESENSIYGYGWDVSQTDRMTTQVWHNGSNRIFYADFLRYIDENITLIMLTNKSHQNFNNLCFDVSKMIFNPNFKPEIPIPDNSLNRNFTSLILRTIEDYGLEKAKEEFNKRDEDVNLLEFMMREAGFNHIDNNQPNIAILIFEMNVYAHPKSAKALQGLGEGHMETGNIEMALKYFKQSLAINPNSIFVYEMIKELEKK
jgi:CubicO group peptidase (beta-lactamase class C family)